MTPIKICPPQYIKRWGKWKLLNEGFILYEENGLLFREVLKNEQYERNKYTHKPKV